MGSVVGLDLGLLLEIGTALEIPRKTTLRLYTHLDRGCRDGLEELREQSRSEVGE
jgi:hypothetical protein